MLNDNYLRMQKILDKVIPLYLKEEPRLMCYTLHRACNQGIITIEERFYAIEEVRDYLEHLGMDRRLGTLRVALHRANLNSSPQDLEHIYRNWSDRPITSPTLEQKWITQALSYGEGVWEGLTIARGAGDLTWTQVELVKYAIYEFIEEYGCEPTIQELKDWTAVQQQN